MVTYPLNSLLIFLEQFCHPLPNELDHCALDDCLWFVVFHNDVWLIHQCHISALALPLSILEKAYEQRTGEILEAVDQNQIPEFHSHYQFWKMYKWLWRNASIAIKLPTFESMTTYRRKFKKFLSNSKLATNLPRYFKIKSFADERLYNSAIYSKF